jgi:plastocyanin
VTVSATFTQAGDYAYFCLIHPQMNGTIHVAAAGTPYPEPQVLYTAQARSEGAALVGQGLGLLTQGLAAAIQASPVQQTAVTAGIGEVFPGVGSLEVARFLPEQRIVHVGQTVTWTNLDPETPHTVTFGTLPQDQVPPGPTVPEQPISVGPAGNTPGSLAPGQGTLNAPPSSSQWLSSGYIGAGRPLGASFKVTFDAPGTYPYYCALHDVLGMRGTIVVEP